MPKAWELTDYGSMVQGRRSIEPPDHDGDVWIEDDEGDGVYVPFFALKEFVERHDKGAAAAIIAEIKEVAAADDDGASTPGGVEHVGDFRRLIRRWSNLLKGGA